MPDQGFLKVETKNAFTAESAKNAEKNLKNSATPAFSAVNFWYSTNLRKPCMPDCAFFASARPREAPSLGAITTGISEDPEKFDAIHEQ